MNKTVEFIRMQDGTPEDYRLLAELEQEFTRRLPERIVGALQKLEAGLAGYRVTRLQHSLQAATRARRDGADDELIVAALVHDIGDELAPYNHAEVAASILRPYVRPEVAWIVEQHGLFQSYYYAHHHGGDRHGRDRFATHPWSQACRDFCEKYDECSFDPEYICDSLESFEPLVTTIFTLPPHTVIAPPAVRPPGAAFLSGA